MPQEVRQLKPPYLVLGNHVGFWDPFVAGNFLPYFVHFVSSDVAFTNPFFNYFLTRLGTIPKKKNVRDTRVIRDIVAVIQQGESVGIYPEAVRNWAGTSFPIDPSIAKLIKMLKVPVVVPKLKGMNLFNPRWSTKLRRTRVFVEYSVLFTADQVKEFSLEEIQTYLANALRHDEVDYQRDAMIPVKSKVLAEHISHALYVCPHCKSIDSFSCSGNKFCCTECDYDIRIDQFFFFARITEGELYFDNMRDWYYWQERYLSDLMLHHIQNKYTEAILTDYNSEIFFAESGATLESLGNGDISLFVDRIEIDFYQREKQILNFHDLQTLNPQVHERLEITYGDKSYRIVGGRDGVSALKWEVAVNVIWRELGQKSKLSPYICP